MYKVILEKTVQKFLLKHKGEELIDKFERAIRILALDPYENNLDIKVLVGLPNSYRLRIGDFRFIYEIIEKNLVISFFDAGNRGDIYKKIK
ncbi:type II toxin-antitoxin system RelE/ParE family toxin [Candidatus Gracilibacteria bacterium]|nr:type II toxin-antitoxin system RelE/ParE family toxin [Candidatus Gracilibacteria bacterium]NUJ99013.1 type II toxin-antitoxin system RelE/ParE family toxin [Candidatus Gracilibacteria bacterium]